jgi:dTDP-4-amino-4,6-dideoxygalactose transaminase
MLAAAVKRPAGLPRWDQFDGAAVVPTYLGRVAIRRLCRDLGLAGGDEILAPSYNCGSEIDPLLAGGASVTLYRVGRDARIDVKDIADRVTERTRAVYVTHYFGWAQPLAEVSALCKSRGLLLIEDCALALFSRDDLGPVGTTGDAAVFSLRKFLPVPDGGVLCLRGRDTTEGMRSPPAGRTARNMLPLFKSQVFRGLERFGLYSPLRAAMLRRGRVSRTTGATEGLPDMPADYYFDAGMEDWSMSSLARGIAAGIDPHAVIDRRRTNYLALAGMTQGLPHVEPLFRELPEGVCPMAMPILTPRRDAVTASLNAHGIAAFPFWKGYHRGFDWSGFPDARFLKDHLLTLPVHQSLTVVHMSYIAQVLSGAVSGPIALG